MKTAEYIAIFAAILGSSVFAAWLTQWLTTRRDDGVRDREVAYLALRLATKFENYGYRAMHFVGDLAAFFANQAQSPGELPRFENLPSEQERWRDLHPSLTSEILAFDDRRMTFQKRIWDDDDGDTLELYREAAILLGARAYRLASALREHHGLPENETAKLWALDTYARYRLLPTNAQNIEPILLPNKRRVLRWRRDTSI